MNLVVGIAIVLGSIWAFAHLVPSISAEMHPPKEQPTFIAG